MDDKDENFQSQLNMRIQIQTHIIVFASVPMLYIALDGKHDSHYS